MQKLPSRKHSALLSPETSSISRNDSRSSNYTHPKLHWRFSYVRKQRLNMSQHRQLSTPRRQSRRILSSFDLELKIYDFGSNSSVQTVITIYGANNTPYIYMGTISGF